MSHNIKVFFPTGEIRRFGVDLPHDEKTCIQLKVFSKLVQKSLALIKHNLENPNVTDSWVVVYQDPENDWINLDKDEEFFECIKLSKGDIKLKFIDPIKKEVNPIVVPEVKKQEPIKVISKLIHKGVSCDHCHTKDIEGVRFKCAMCPNYDLCENCHPVFSKVHNHVFVQMMYPQVYPQEDKPIVEDKPVHNATCDGCQLKKISGKRYKCLNCPDYDLCETCFENRVKRGIHYNNHVFRTIAKPEEIKPIVVNPPPHVFPHRNPPVSMFGQNAPYIERDQPIAKK